MPEAVQIWKVSILPDGAKKTIVDPTEQAQEKREERSNSQTNSAWITTSGQTRGGRGDVSMDNA